MVLVRYTQPDRFWIAPVLLDSFAASIMFAVTLCPEEPSKETRVSPSDDAALMHRIAQGDERAFDRFYERHKAAVYGLARSILGEPAAAEEATLDVFVQIWRHAVTYNAQGAAVRTWLLAISRNKAIDRLRRTKARPDQGQPQWDDAELASLSTAGDPEEALAEREQRRRVVRALRELPATQRQVLALAYFKGYAHGRIAQTLALPLGTVKTRIRAAMQQLKTVLEEK